MSYILVEKDMSLLWSVIKNICMSANPLVHDFLTIVRLQEGELGIFDRKEMGMVAYVTIIGEDIKTCHNKASTTTLVRIKDLVEKNQIPLQGTRLFFNDYGILCGAAYALTLSEEVLDKKMLPYSGVLELGKMLGVNVIKPKSFGKAADILKEIATHLAKNECYDIQLLMNDGVCSVPKRFLPFIALASMTLSSIRSFKVLKDGRTDAIEKEFWLRLYDTDPELFQILDKANFDFPEKLEAMDEFITICEDLTKNRSH